MDLYTITHVWWQVQVVRGETGLMLYQGGEQNWTVNIPPLSMVAWGVQLRIIDYYDPL